MTEQHPDPPQPQEPQEPRDQDATAQPGPRDSAGESSPPPQQPESTPDPFAETAPIAGPASGDEPQAPVPPPPPPASPVPLAPPPPVAPPPPGAADAGAWPPPPPPPPPYGAPPPGQPGQPGPPPPGYPAYGAPPPGYGYPPEIPGQKSKLVAGLLGVFLGGFGIHRFYLGYTTIGIVQIIVTVCTLGIGAIWGFIEGILILVGSTITTDAKGIPLKDS